MLGKKAEVFALPKTGKDLSDPINYRPIFLTSNLSKTMEDMVNKRLVNYLETNNLLSNFQSGFREHHSTIDHIVTYKLKLIRPFSKDKW